MGENQELEKQRDIAMRICREHDIAWDEDLDVPTLNGEPVTAKTVSDVFCENDTYIKREAALALVQPDDPSDEKAAVTIATAKKLIRNLLSRTPAVDVVPVVHGRWLLRENGGAVCSRCGHYTQYKGHVLDMSEAIACPWCGAKMDGGADHAAD